ncbi:MAG TPA: TolC family protein [Nitrospira sp.]|nr:TolC family protein [Nitrospira sp.]MCW5793609.1 TolC family protein [Nitrospira sp.]HMU30957.1 TolC family protein [Nitrospira sp.]HMV57953.1 TolC family protein [Nitrospira sp.]HMW87211.1 TolC family protein [Nitrospira sp.]
MRALSSVDRYSRTMRDDMSQHKNGSPSGVRLWHQHPGLWVLIALLGLTLFGSGWVRAAESTTIPAGSFAPPVVRLNLSEAVALFLKQNFDLLIAKYGIESSKGQQITARLFPNPVAQIGTVASFTHGNTAANSGALTMQVQQLFELAGKRGYRIESAGFGVQSAEADFEDAIRQLGFTLKDAYYRVLVAQRRLALAEENRDRFARILDVNTIRFKKGYIAEVDLIRIRLQVVDFQSQVIESIQEGESARADLRQLLRLSPASKLELTTEMDYRRVDPDMGKLRSVALDVRPDIRSRRALVAQREADLKLAKAFRVPDLTIGAGYSIQGPRGPDNPQMGILNLGVPLPLFNRNQGGIVQAEVGVQSAQAELDRTVNQVENQVDVAYHNLLQSRRLVEAYLAGVLEDARSTFTIVERAYERGGATILDLLDAARTSRTIQQNFIEALFSYQRNLFQLESSVGQEITS